ncbi:hypothetical protein K439DRAFT_1615297 [Ramaria rubella]|nr:hypothetical protein K439DRAFT_1615297 [Ramaria rubella]
MALEPAWPKLTWAQIVEYTMLAEFELLWSAAHDDIRNLQWEDAKNRQAAICHLKILQAHEEVTHLNIEVKQLVTWIMDEGKSFEAVTQNNTANDPLIAAALWDLAAEHERVNTNLAATLQQIYPLPQGRKMWVR